MRRYCLILGAFLLLCPLILAGQERKTSTPPAMQHSYKSGHLNGFEGNIFPAVYIQSPEHGRQFRTIRVACRTQTNRITRRADAATEPFKAAPPASLLPAVYVARMR